MGASEGSAGRDRYWRREMVRLAGVHPDDVLLDLACGTGRIAIPLAQAGIEVTGIDLSREMLAKAQEKADAQGVSRCHVEGDFPQY